MLVTKQVRVVTEQVRAVYKNRYSNIYRDRQSDQLVNTCLHCSLVSYTHKGKK